MRSGDRDGGSKLRHLNLSGSSFAGNIRWFGVGVGILAIFAIPALFCEYFSRLGIGGAEPDPYARPQGNHHRHCVRCVLVNWRLAASLIKKNVSAESV